MLGHNNVLEQTFVMDDSTGILQTPRHELNRLFVKTLFEPAVQELSQNIQLTSTILPQFNGTYKVLSIKHQGMISAAVCGRATSDFLLSAQGMYDGFKIVQPAKAA